MDTSGEQTPDASRGDPGKPLPSDFEVYLPWACNQLQVDYNIMINKVYQNEYVGVSQTDRSKGKGKIKSKHEPSKALQDSGDKKESNLKQTFSAENILQIDAVYDNGDNLIELKFNKNRHIPTKVLKIIGLILPFHKYVTALTINRGLNRTTLYELSKIVPHSMITDVCLDNTVIPGANYDTLLEKQNVIRQLSLARCKIGDEIVEKIAEKLLYPLPSSKSLVILNLSSNMITDTGAKHLAEVLRSNRQLSYLNLSGNLLNDDGARAILDTLVEFPLTSEELLSSRARHMEYLKEKNNLITRMMVELRAGDFEKKPIRKKSVRPPATPLSTRRRSKLEKEGSLKGVADVGKSILSMDAVWYEKAQNMAENAIGEFQDPFASQNVYAKDEIVYCYGNNRLSYINFCYNSLSFLTIRKILSVLKYQKLLNRNPRGLVNISIEGNYMPSCCKELMMIDELIEIGLMANCRKLSALSKKRPVSKAK